MTSLSNAAFITATELLGQLRRGTISAVTATRAYLDRVAELDPRMRGFAAIDPGQALTDAARADERRKAGDDGLLLGLPIPIKDVIDTVDYPTTYGSAAFKAHRPRADAECVRRLKRAGAVIMGKANTFEFAFSAPSPLFRDSRNPWGARRVTGGSSNGSATVVAAGLCAASLGTDTAGSIRVPASYCGLVGLKPTHGRVSIAGVGCLAYVMDTVGPLTRSVADAALILQAIAGHDPADPESLDVAIDDYVGAVARPVAGLRVGVPRRLFPQHVATEVAATVRRAADALAAQNATLVEVDLPEMSDVAGLWFTLAAAEAWSWHQGSFATDPDLYGTLPRMALEKMRQVSAADYVRARRRRYALRREILEAMSKCAVLLMPATPTPAFSFEEAKAGAVDCDGHKLDIETATTGFTRPFNITGQPAIVLPVRASSAGLPIAVQVIGKPFAEATLLSVAAAIERAAAFDFRAPELRSAE